MNTDALLEAFENSLRPYPDLPIGTMKHTLRQSLERKKYDSQDEALIEAILNDREKQLEESYKEVLSSYLSKERPETHPADFLKGEEGQNKAVELFISTLDRLIDYFYNVLIAKHFAGS